MGYKDKVDIRIPRTTKTNLEEAISNNGMADVFGSWKDFLGWVTDKINDKTLSYSKLPSLDSLCTAKSSLTPINTDFSNKSVSGCKVHKYINNTGDKKNNEVRPLPTREGTSIKLMRLRPTPNKTKGFYP